MKFNTTEDLFMDQIRGVYDVEKQLVRALPKMVKAAESEELAEGLRSHFVETNKHVLRLKQIFGGGSVCNWGDQRASYLSRLKPPSLRRDRHGAHS